MRKIDLDASTLMRGRLLLTKCRLVFLYLTFYITQAATAQTANRFDLVISEIHPDPSPAIGLPEFEFIEVRNNSGKSIDLKNWKISDGSSTAIIKENIILPPATCIIICPAAASSAFTAFGLVAGITGFPSLNNEGDEVSLLSPEGKLIHAVSYQRHWFRNEVKSEGGWSLEMIDPENPCGGYNNWTASTHGTGGTPGQPNAVQAHNPDALPPALLRTYTIDSVTIAAVFDEPLDSTAAAQPLHYKLTAIGHPKSVKPVGPLYTTVILSLPQTLQAGTSYELSTTAIADCSGNVIGQMNKALAGLPIPASNGGIVINELLFNPASNGYDYVELFNAGNAPVNITQLYLTNRSAGALTNLKQLSDHPFLFFPGTFLVITENSQWLQHHYRVKDPSHIIEVPALPSLPDNRGHLVLTNHLGQVVDELQYEQQWHFPLIHDADGVSLERIDYKNPTQDPHNWTSAAATAGFGTPGQQNSQFRSVPGTAAAISVFPAIFSPDQDGQDDFATIHYQLLQPGHAANIIVFDAAGCAVRYLAKNAILGATGNFRWDGLDENAGRLPVGMYIVLMEIFHPQGGSKKFKEAVVLSRRW